jgi:hypothetical protein
MEQPTNSTESSSSRTYFDAEKLIRSIYNKIAVWHNNENKLNPTEMQRDLRWLSSDIIQEVIATVHNKLDVEIRADIDAAREIPKT